MPRITKQEILKRVRAAMTPVQPQTTANRGTLSQHSLNGLLQKAKQKRTTTPLMKPKFTGEQKADLKAKGL